MQNLYKAILGEKNYIYYLTKFEQFDLRGPGLRASWNWPALLFSGIWALYRKMYGWFFALWGIAALSAIVEREGSPSISALVAIAPAIAFAVFANSLYHWSIKKKIAVAQLTIKDESKLIEYLRYKGGINKWVFWIIGLIVIGIIAAILIPMFAKIGKSNPDRSAVIEKSTSISKAPLPAPTTEPTAKAIVGREAPDLFLKDPDANVLNTTDLKGSVLFINFWASWCQPCRDEMPSIQGLYNQMKDNKQFRIVIILYKDDYKSAIKFFKENNFNLLVFIDNDGGTARAYGVTGVPETYIIDKKGVLRKKFKGPAEWNSPKAVAAITGLINEQL